MAYFAVRSFTEVLPGLFPLAGFTLAVLLLTSSSPPPSAVPLRERLLRGEWIPRALVAFGLGLAAISVGRLPSPAETPRHLAADSERIRRPWREAVERIRRETTRGEAVLVIAPWGDAVAREAGARNVFPFAYAASLVSARTQVPIVLEAVERNGVRFVLETPIGEPFRTRSPRPLVAALEAVGFRCDEEGGGMSCRRGAPPP